ncbi:MAG: monovalent cation/H+ antiporter complex subunit F [Atribacterota bacterium]
MNIIMVIITILGVTALLTIYRVIVGPTHWDRLIAVNLMSSKVVNIMVAAALLFRSNIYLDVALVYAIIGFVSTIAVSKFLEGEERNKK